MDAKVLCDAQIKPLLLGIKENKCYERLFRVGDHALADIKGSPSCLPKCNIKPRDKGAYRLVDGLGNIMLGYSNTLRHNGVLKFIHLTISLKAPKCLENPTITLISGCFSK